MPDQSRSIIEVSEDAAAASLHLREPRRGDAPLVHRLIADLPGMDGNSLYCNALQCSHFADTCAAAERAGELVGWASGYRHPDDPRTLFIWQVAVRAGARGLGLATRLILAILERPACREVTRLSATVTADNAASFALFEGLARRLSAPFRRGEGFDRDRDFGGAHASEHAVAIGPFANPGAGARTRLSTNPEDI